MSKVHDSEFFTSWVSCIVWGDFGIVNSDLTGFASTSQTLTIVLRHRYAKGFCMTCGRHCFPSYLDTGWCVSDFLKLTTWFMIFPSVSPKITVERLILDKIDNMNPIAPFWNSLLPWSRSTCSWTWPLSISGATFTYKLHPSSSCSTMPFQTNSFNLR